MKTLARRPILEPGRSCWVVAPARSSGLLIDGRAYYKAFYEAARRAERYILLCGWQFDSDLPLLRGEDRSPEHGGARFCDFLSSLVRARPELKIVLLCWDYSMAYMFDREWFQEFVFRTKSEGRLRFLFDDRHAVGASHHQKFAVIDGALAFLGSMDFCHDRFDDRRHAADSPFRREPSGEDGYGPYHEAQAYVTGPAVAELRELFEARWRHAGGEDLKLPPAREELEVPLRPSLKIDAAEVGLSRTMARTLLPEHPSVREIEALYRSAIASADSHIYMENQYFGSRAVFDALAERLGAAGRPKIKLIMVYPRELVSITESMSMGASQNGMFAALKDLAAREGHDFGLYYSRSKVPGEEEKPRYIHSKLLLVDDRFLTVGSANTNNRSMGFDSELNISWEAPPDGDPALERSLRRVRLSLLAEHAGLSPRVALRRLGDVETLVETLDVLANDPDAALRRRPVPASADERDWPALDPTGPVEEDVFEPVAPRRRALLRRGFRRLRRVLGRRRRGLAVDPPGALATAPDPWRLTLSQAAWRASFLTLLLALALGVAWAVTTTAGFLLGR